MFLAQSVSHSFTGPWIWTHVLEARIIEIDIDLFLGPYIVKSSYTPVLGCCRLPLPMALNERSRKLRNFGVKNMAFAISR